MNWWVELAPGLTIIALLVACLWILQRKGLARLRFPGLNSSSSINKQIQILERQAISGQHTLYLVQVGKVKMLLAGAPSACQLIAVLPESRPAAERPRHPEELV